MSTEGKNIASAGVSRRSFLMGLGATAAVVAGSGLAGCAPQNTAAPASTESGSSRKRRQRRAQPTPEARHHQPPPRPRPKRKADVDFVIVGSGVVGERP
ncbi:MAG: hypothetical protein ACLTMP_01405 [Eggerthella lenta]